MYDPQQYAYFNDKPELQTDASRTLFIGDLSYFCSEEDLCTLFAPYGRILTVRVRRGVTGESLMHGFIALDTPEAAQRAIIDLDGVEFMGRNMRVQLSSDGQRPNVMAKENFVQVHVSFISKQTNMIITEKVLRDIFSPFGAIADVAIKKHTTIQKQHRQSGYGFVYFVEADSAYRAMATLKHNTVRDITLDCSISHKSEHLIRSSRQPTQSWEQELYNNPAIGKKSLSFFEGSTSQHAAFNNNNNNASGHNFFRTHSAESILRDRYGNMLSPPHPGVVRGNGLSPTAIQSYRANGGANLHQGNLQQHNNMGMLPPPPSHDSPMMSSQQGGLSVHHRTLTQTSSFNSNYSDRVGRSIGRPESDYSIGSTSSNGSGSQYQLYSTGSASNMISPAASQTGSTTGYHSTTSTPKRGLLQQSQFDSFYGEPIMSLSTSTSFHLQDLDSLLSLSTVPSVGNGNGNGNNNAMSSYNLNNSNNNSNNNNNIHMNNLSNNNIININNVSNNTSSNDIINLQQDLDSLLSLSSSSTVPSAGVINGNSAGVVSYAARMNNSSNNNLNTPISTLTNNSFQDLDALLSLPNGPSTSSQNSNGSTSVTPSIPFSSSTSGANGGGIGGSNNSNIINISAYNLSNNSSSNNQVHHQHQQPHQDLDL